MKHRYLSPRIVYFWLLLDDKGMMRPSSSNLKVIADMTVPGTLQPNSAPSLHLPDIPVISSQSTARFFASFSRRKEDGHLSLSGLNSNEHCFAPSNVSCLFQWPLRSRRRMTLEVAHGSRRHWSRSCPNSTSSVRGIRHRFHQLMVPQDKFQSRPHETRVHGCSKCSVVQQNLAGCRFRVVTECLSLA